MSKLSPLEVSMLADNALSDEARKIAEEQLEASETDRARLDALLVEREAMIAALAVEPLTEEIDIPAPRFAKTMSLRGFAMANVVTGLVIWGAQFLWKTLFGELVVNATTWFTSIYLPDVYEMTRTTTLFLFEEGATMIDAYMSFIVACVVTVAMLWIAVVYRRSRVSISVCVLVASLGITLQSAPVQALDVRNSEGVLTIPASETVDDTLIVAGERIVIAGTITGDVIAAGRNIEVSGTVGGNLLTFGEMVELSGSVGGFALGGVSTYEIEGGSVAGDLWVGAETVSVDSDSTVGRNVTTAVRLSSVDGSVGRDYYVFGETAELNGQVQGNVEFFGNRVYLLDEAVVGNSVRIRSGNPDALHQADSAEVQGEVEFLDLPEEFEQRSPYATLGFYLWQLGYLIGAFLVGIGLLWLVPGLREVSLNTGSEGLKTAGIGFLAFVSIPAMAVLVAITVVGLPIAFIGMAAWLLGWYLSKVVVGYMIGQMVIGDKDSTPISLLVGLGIVVVVINIPFIGGILSFLLTVIGLGLIVQYLMGAIPARDYAEA